MAFRRRQSVAVILDSIDLTRFRREGELGSRGGHKNANESFNGH